MFIAEDACQSLAAHLQLPSQQEPTQHLREWGGGMGRLSSTCATSLWTRPQAAQPFTCMSPVLSLLLCGGTGPPLLSLSPLPQYPPERRCFIVAKTIDSGGRLCGPEQLTFPLRPSIYHLYCEQIESGSLIGSW